MPLIGESDLFVIEIEAEVFYTHGPDRECIPSDVVIHTQGLSEKAIKDLKGLAIAQFFRRQQEARSHARAKADR